MQLCEMGKCIIMSMSQLLIGVHSNDATNVKNVVVIRQHSCTGK